MGDSVEAARAAAEAAARRSYGKLIAFLAARTPDVGRRERCPFRGVSRQH